MAPTKPTATAAQRRGPTRSPSKCGDSAVTMIGLDSEIEAAVASGIWAMPWKNRYDEKNSSIPRTIWVSSRRIENSFQPLRGRNIANMKTKAKK